MYGYNSNIDYVKKVLDVDEDILEFMCHPALIDQRLYDMTSYGLPRMKELDLILSNELASYIKDNHIELINFSDIKKR